MCKLSICMMVKDEEKNLNRCLDSIKPIIEEGIAELIIVDTGSSDKTVDIAKEYTDKVYFHLWNNDFSSMRNISISYAKGEWIFIVDADERLDNTQDLIKLMKSQEVEDFNTVLLKVKNLNASNNEENFSVNVSPRIFRNDGEFKYEGSVHNQPVFKGPNLSVDISLTHFGYDVTDKELMEKKFIRTSTLLKNELKKDPKNLYYKYQLGVTYDMHNDFKDSLEQFRQCYEILKNKNKQTKLQYMYIYCSYVRIAIKNGKYNEIIDVSKEAIKLKQDYVDLYYLLATAEKSIGNQEQASKYFLKYLDEVDKYNDSDISTDMSIIMYHLDEESKANAYYYVVLYYIENKEYEKAYEYVILIKDKIKKNGLMPRILLSLKKLSELKKYYSEIIEDESLTNYFLSNLEVQINKLSIDEQEEIYTKLVDLEGEYGLYCKINILKDDEKIAAVKEFSNTVNFSNKPLFYSRIFKEIFNDRKVLLNCFKKVSLYDLRGIIKYLLNEYKESKEIFENCLLDWNIRPNDVSANKVYIALAPVIFVNNYEESKAIDDTDYSFFENYIEKGISYVSQLYKMEKVRIIYKEVSNSEEKYFMLMYLVKEYLLKNDTVGAIRYLKEALKCNKEIIKYMEKYMEELLNFIDKGE